MTDESLAVVLRGFAKQLQVAIVEAESLLENVDIERYGYRKTFEIEFAKDPTLEAFEMQPLIGSVEKGSPKCLDSIRVVLGELVDSVELLSSQRVE